VLIEKLVDAKLRSFRECGKCVMRRWLGAVVDRRAFRCCGRPESVKVLW
jgi:hypothetical protein